MSQKTVKLSFVPREHQKSAYLGMKRFSVLVWHRRAGKTIFAVIILILKALSCRKEAGRFGYVAPFYGQAKSVCWEILKKFAREVPGVEIREGDLTVRFSNGNTIRLFGADNPDALRGLYFDGIVLDEVGDMKPRMWQEIIRPALTDRQGWAIFIGTPKGINLFSELYNHALGDPEWFADIKRVGDTKAIPEAEVNQARNEMAPPIFAQEFECDFNAATINSVIPLDLALNATQRYLNRNDYHYAPKILGGDVARFGDDRSVLVIRQGLQAFQPLVMQKIDTMEYSNQVIHIQESEKPDMTFIDEIGVGAGVVDRLRQLARPRVLGVNSGARATDPKMKNLRAQMWWKTAEWLKNGGCLPNCPELVTDLCAPIYWYDEANRFCVESGEQMKKRGLRSPDLAAGLYLTFASPVEKVTEYQQEKIRLNPKAQNMTISEFDSLTGNL